MADIRVLQLGTEDWSEKYDLPAGVRWGYVDKLEAAPKKPFDIVFLDRNPRKDEIRYLEESTKPYTLFCTEKVTERELSLRPFYRKKRGQKISSEDVQEFLMKDLPSYYPKPYGEKFRMYSISIAHGFKGSVKWNGDCNLTLEGDFGEELSQIVYWRNNIPIAENQTLDLWLEYKHTADVEVSLVVTQFYQGSIGEVQQVWNFDQDELDKVIRIENKKKAGPLFFSLRAKGSGELQIMALHDRFSRKTHGYFLPGGDRYVTSDRQELFCYFDPGDMKPPLNVYFSGYKTMEGFEGYNMMRQMGCPFLLVAETRLEGGAFYMGSEEYETMLSGAIRKYMRQLGFTPDQVIFSGLSMGTYGALYYGCEILPHAIIIGKPLASIGNVASNERLLRPGGFPTSLDVLMNLYGGTDRQAIKALNARFWDKFDKADWRWTKFAIAYMIEDDYDMDAYRTILSHLGNGEVEVLGKGIHGRHNDNTNGIVTWFVGQYNRIIKEDFRQ